MNLMQRHSRIENAKHLDFIRGLSCIVCGDNTSTEAAHVRFACIAAAKRHVGKAEKPDDKWAIPLCGECHCTQHEGAETTFWAHRNIDPIFVCLALWSVTGDHELGERILKANT